jgi:LMBR1 domain-containing protein 1
MNNPSLLFIAIKPNGVPASSFLNKILLGLEAGNAGFIATAIFAFLSLYLLWCVQKGNIKFGVRIPFIFSLHIMKYAYVASLRVNETWMNTFLFNVSLILIASVAVTQFCTKAFAQYVRLSTIDCNPNSLKLVLFGTQI